MTQVAGDQELIKVCAKLSGSAETKVRARANFYAAAPPERVRYYVLQEAEDLSACHLIALLTDLPPDWIFNCYTDRKGFMPKDWPVNFAHRGASSRAPENTLESFELAIEEGAGGLALEVHMTLDRKIVVMCDATVDRTTDGSGSVAEKPLDELRSLDAGYWFSSDGGRTHPYRGRGVRIPMLAEVYEEFPDALLNIEIKEAQQEIEKTVLKVIRDAGAEERTLVVSNDDAVVKRFRELSGGQVSTGASRQEIEWFYILSRWRLERIARPGYEALQVPVEHEGTTLATPRFVNAAHAREVRVDVWTIDDPAEMLRLHNLGVDAIMTDRPDVLAELLNKCWITVPAI
jgi:glycerophosphoryl diester phosphodiesterase